MKRLWERKLLIWARENIIIEDWKKSEKKQERP
jgi:hypothetical protein